MRVVLKTSSVALPRHAHRRLQQRVAKALHGVSDRVRAVYVSLKDVNAGKGGVDKVCLLEAKLESGGGVVVVRKSGHIAKALNEGLRGVRRLVNEELKKRRSFRGVSKQEVLS